MPGEQHKMGLPVALNPQLSSPASPQVAWSFLGEQIPSAQKGEAFGSRIPPLAGDGDGFTVIKAAAPVMLVVRGTLLAVCNLFL